MKDLFQELPDALKADKWPLERIAELPYFTVHEISVHEGTFGRFVRARCTAPSGEWFVLSTGARPVVEALECLQDKVPGELRLVRSGRTWRVASPNRR